MANTSRIALDSVERLTGSENYAIWKIQMTDVLTYCNLEAHIEDAAASKNIKPEDVSGVDWRSSDKQALAMIRLRVAPSVIRSIATCKHALDAWNALKQRYESSGALAIVLAKQKLYSTRIDDGADLEEHIRTMQGYLADLHTLGDSITDSDFSGALLMSLPQSWHSFIQASIRTDDFKKPESIIASILLEHRRLHAHDAHDAPDLSNGSTSLVARSGKPRRNGALKSASPSQPTSRGAQQARCYNCGGFGHLARDCPSPPSSDDVAGFADDFDNDDPVVLDPNEDFGFFAF